jgi:predicted  nucleic acid-binding Zn-ribbon protein
MNLTLTKRGNKMNDLQIQIDDLEDEKRTLECQIVDIEKEIDDFAKEDYITDEQYREMLDDCFEDVEIAGMTYCTSYALKETDPIAYRCGYSDYADSVELEDIEEYNALVSDLEDLQSELEDLEEQIEELQNELDELEEEE